MVIRIVRHTFAFDLVCWESLCEGHDVFDLFDLGLGLVGNW